MQCSIIAAWRRDQTRSRSGILRSSQLLSTLDAAFERVKGNPDRSLSINPDLLKDTYERVAELLPTMLPSEWVFDTTTTAPRTIVDRIAETLLA